jgi:methylenetetrahydrofolate reductase (NADPH)
MKREKKFFNQIKDGDFLVTAEYLPKAAADDSSVKSVIQILKDVPSAVNVSDNPFGVALSSLAASVMLSQAGVEPIYQLVTRDRNRIAIQSDLLGAASLGINNALCLSGYHQTLTDSNESANVYDIDSTQLILMIKKMREKSELLNGAKIGSSFSMITGAAANPFLAPIELNLIRLSQKIESGAAFIQTQAVFKMDEFKKWIDSLNAARLSDKAAIIAGVLPLDSAEEAESLSKKYTEIQIPAGVIDRLKKSGDKAAQKKEGIAICLETIEKIKKIQGVRGIHILSGGKEEMLPEILNASGLSGKK